MSVITPEEVSRIATLARLGLTDQEKVEAAAKLASVLEHFTSIQTIPTTNVPPADAASGLTNITRRDQPNQELCLPAALLAAAPATLRKHIQVKAVF